MLHQLCQHLHQFFRLLKACIHICDPRAAPAGMCAAVRQTLPDCLRGGVCKCGGRARSDLLSRVQRKELRDMPVTGFRLLVIRRPFHDLPVSADLRLRQMCKLLSHGIRQDMMHAENPVGLDHIRVELRNDLTVHGGCFAETAGLSVREPVCVFRRHARTGHELSCCIFGQIAGEKKCRTVQNGEITPEKRLVLRKPVMLHDMQGEPCTAGRPDRCRHPEILRRGVAPQVRVMMTAEAVLPVHFSCSHGAVFCDPFKQFKQRQVTFRQIAAFCGPVIHLRIDIDRKPAAPCRPHILIPDALKIQRQRAFSAACNHQIPSVIEIQRQ